ncbi:hypothetical protein ACIBQ5_36650 [Streptomyces massasporeus]|uniref:hypothetical protein n=1 Tax=Streptomyces massasporeus TaxID=67324 RepID=UPI0037B9D8EE
MPRKSVAAVLRRRGEAGPTELPFIADSEQHGGIARTGDTRLLHRVLIPLLGMVLGELRAPDGLTARCAEDHRWHRVVVAHPLHLTGGTGSPADAGAVGQRSGAAASEGV